MPSDPQPVEAALARALGEPVVERRPLHGGDIATSARVRLASGRSIFVKTHPLGVAMFEAEAAGLRWLAEPGVLRIPEVLAVGPPDAPFLALELIASAPPRPDHDAALGRGLAELHRYGAPAFGFPTDNFVGALPQANDESPTWPEFYRDRRLAPLVARAAARGLLDRSLVARFDRLYARFPELCGPPEPPARLHGDLWAGNAITGEHGEPVILDPAVYGGHREIDLAMMRLFGGFSPRCFAAYEECFPLAPGAERRVSLYQLYPLLVHVNLFGRGYLGQTVRALEDLV